jgi:hypothetical protein
MTNADKRGVGHFLFLGRERTQWAQKGRKIQADEP